MLGHLILALLAIGGYTTTTSHDPGGFGQYPADVVHYGHAIPEDTAADHCAARGGSLIDAPVERFLCIID